jgi:sporulation protein YlmC with PRC-barrel domain
MKKIILTGLIGMVAAMGSVQVANAQIAGGSTTVGVTLTEATQLAAGWSVKKTLLGKAVYNDAGEKIGKLEDLIVAPDRNVSYVIVGAGGFVGIGRHDVAIPVNQVQEKDGKLVIAGASKSALKAMPVFEYARNTAGRDQLIASSEKDIAAAKAKMAELQKKAGESAGEVKVALNAQVAALEADATAAENKLSAMKRASAKRWKEFEAEVKTAMAKLRKSLDATKA